MFGGELAHLRVIHGGQTAVPDYSVLRAVFCRYHQCWEKEMDMQVAIQESALACPFFFRRPPEGAESHVDHARAPSFPFETARAVLLDVARAMDLWVRSNSSFPEVKESRAGKAGIMNALSLFQEIPPGISVTCSAIHLNDLTAFKLDPDAWECPGKVARGAGHDAGRIFFGDERGYRMAEQMAVPGDGRETITGPVIVFLPVGPGEVCSLGVGQMGAAAAPLFPYETPCLVVYKPVEVHGIDG